MQNRHRRFFIKRGLFCEKCGQNKFKTVIKGRQYQCRACNHITTIGEG